MRWRTELAAGAAAEPAAVHRTNEQRAVAAACARHSGAAAGAVVQAQPRDRGRHGTQHGAARSMAHSQQRSEAKQVRLKVDSPHRTRDLRASSRRASSRLAVQASALEGAWESASMIGRETCIVLPKGMETGLQPATPRCARFARPPRQGGCGPVAKWERA